MYGYCSISIYWSYVISLTLLTIDLLKIWRFILLSITSFKKTNNKGILQIGITSILYKTWNLWTRSTCKIIGWSILTSNIFHIHIKKVIHLTSNLYYKTKWYNVFNFIWYNILNYLKHLFWYNIKILKRERQAREKVLFELD